MELRHLRYFITVAEELNFRSAAKKLHVSHPALSKQIKDLEYEVGVELLGRNTVNVWLTVPGKRFLVDAKAILAQVEQAVATVKSEASADNVLVIANCGPFWSSALYDLLKTFRIKHPRIDIRIVDKEPWNQISALLGGEFQVGFVGEREALERPTLSHKLMLKSSFGVVLGVDHHLAGRHELCCDDICNEKIYCLGSGRSSLHLKDIRGMIPKEKLSRNQIKGVESIESMITMITSCQGISLLPQAFVDSRKSTIRFIPLTGVHADRQFQLWAVWRKGDRSEALKAFVDTINEQYRD